MLDFFTASGPIQDMGRIFGNIIGRRPRLTADTSLKQWAAIAAIAIIGGCSWFSDEPSPPPSPVAKPTTVGTSGTIPDVNTVPTEAPKPTITNVDQATQGLGADTSNAQYGDQLTMPSATAPRPEAPAPAETPAAEPTPDAASAPEPASQVAPAPAAQQPQVAQAPLEAAAPAAPAPEPMAPIAGTVIAPQVGAGGVIYQPLTGTPQQGSMPFQPSGDLNLAGASRNTGKAVTVDYSAIGSGGSVGYASAGGYTSTPRFPYANPAQAMYRSPYGLAPYGSNGVIVNNGAPVYGAYPGAYPYSYGQPTGLVYFRNGSASLSSDDRRTLRQIAETQKAYGGVIRVVAHASQHTGNMNINLQDVTNRRMSIARANAVAHALVKYGVQPSLVQIAAAGDDQPVIYPETMPISEAANRRAEVYLSAY
jgi:outer membrane protein OmpA-like peptidoglycan-associated protein